MRAGGGGTGYSLRIFPEKQRFELRRGPAGGGFPVQGKSDAIKKVNERNRIELIATGAEITAVVNGKEVAKVNDSNPGQVAGPQDPLRDRQPVQHEARRPSSATFKRVAVSVPDP